MILVTKPLIRRDRGDILSPLVQFLCVCVCVCVFINLHKCVCVCVCVLIKLHITAQSDPVILVILCHSH